MTKKRTGDFFSNFQIEDELPPLETLKEKEEEKTETPTGEKYDELPEGEVSPLEEKEIPVSEEVQEEEEEVFSLAPLVEAWAEKGILSKVADKNYEDSEEGLEEILTDTLSKRFEEKVNSFDPRIQRIIKLAEQGANIEEVLTQESQTDYSEVDLEDADNQLLLIEEHLLATGYEQEEVQAELDKIKDLGEEAKRAKVAQKYLAKKQSEAKASYDAQVASNKVKADKEAEEELKKFRNEVISKTKIKGISVTKKEAERLADYMTVPVNKKGQTQWQVDNEDRENGMGMALQSMRKFDFKDIEKKAETKATQKLKAVVKRYTDPNAKGKGGQAPVESRESIRIPSFFSHNIEVD